MVGIGIGIAKGPSVRIPIRIGEMDFDSYILGLWSFSLQS